MFALRVASSETRLKRPGGLFSKVSKRFRLISGRIIHITCRKERSSFFYIERTKWFTFVKGETSWAFARLARLQRPDSARRIDDTLGSV